MIRICIILMSILILSNCASKETPVKPVETRVVEVKRPKPILPQVDPLQLRDLNWIIITPENVEEEFKQIQASGKEPVFFALTSKGYENLALNLSDIRALIQQYKGIIAVYDRQF